MDPRELVVARRFAPALIAFVRFNAWLLLVVGVLTLGYAFLFEFTSRLVRGGAFETALGVFGLAWTSSWRRSLAPALAGASHDPSRKGGS